MKPPAPIKQPRGDNSPRHLLRRAELFFLRWRVWITDRRTAGIWESTYFWAAIVGFFGACSSVAFREALKQLQHFLLHYDGPLDLAAANLAWWERIAIPTVGGLVAGAILLLGQRWANAGKSLDFMEVVTLGNGVIRVRATVMKSLSSLVTISTGGSIGREGPMVQLAAMLGSLIGRTAKMSAAQLRLMVACGAAAGIACAYNAPLSGAFFVAEIVLGTIALESFGPLVFASVVATVVARQFLGAEPVYRMPAFGVVPNGQLILHLILGLLVGLAAPLFLVLLRGGEKIFQRLNLPVILKLGLGGLIVGIISTQHPTVWGNGYVFVEEILTSDWGLQALLTILLFKVLATVATTGSGAVGGVFTPTLFCGAVFGALYGDLLRLFLPYNDVNLPSYAIVGMGCFLAATTRAPIMSILIMFEMTHDDSTIMPLMLACVSAFYVARHIDPESVYSRQLRGGKAHAEPPLFLLHVRDLMKAHPVSVVAQAGFEEIAGVLATHTFKHLYVVEKSGRFLGAIALQDLKPFLQDRDLPRMVIALDLMHDDIPVLTEDASLKESLEIFARHDGERLPVIDNSRDRRLVGALAKTDVLLTLAHGAGAAQDEE